MKLLSAAITPIAFAITLAMALAVAPTAADHHEIDGHADTAKDHEANHNGEMIDHPSEAGHSGVPKGVDKQLEKKPAQAAEHSGNGAVQGQEQRQKNQPWWKFWE
jgi:hypothetical protein